MNEENTEDYRPSRKQLHLAERGKMNGGNGQFNIFFLKDRPPLPPGRGGEMNKLSIVKHINVIYLYSYLYYIHIHICSAFSIDFPKIIAACTAEAFSLIFF